MADNAPRLSAALAYYAVFSMAPLILLAVSIAGLVFGKEAARHQLTDTIQQLAGGKAGQAIETMVQSVDQPGTNWIVTSFSILILLFGASGVFAELQSALNSLWGVTLKPDQSLFRIFLDRLLSFVMILGIGFLLLASLTVSVALAAASSFLREWLVFPPALLHALNFLVSFGIVTALFAMIFKILPKVKLHWRDVWIGAAGTAFLFVLGQFLISYYLGVSTVSSSYGAAGSLVIVLVWIYYSSCVLFFGAEFTKIYARKCGGGIEPTDDAMMVPKPNENK